MCPLLRRPTPHRRPSRLVRTRPRPRLRARAPPSRYLRVPCGASPGLTVCLVLVRGQAANSRSSRPAGRPLTQKRPRASELPSATFLSSPANHGRSGPRVQVPGGPAQRLEARPLGRHAGGAAQPEAPSCLPSCSAAVTQPPVRSGEGGVEAAPNTSHAGGKMGTRSKRGRFRKR